VHRIEQPYWVDIVIKMYKLTQKGGGLKYYGDIEDCRHMDKDLEPIAGETIEDLDFDKLLAKVS